MTATNGTLKSKNERLQERIEYTRLRQIRREQKAVEKSLKLLESFDDYDWVKPYVELYDRVSDKDFFGVPFSNLNDRRYGWYYPIFRNEQQLGLLRAPSRILAATNPYAIGLIEGLTSYVIGTGYVYRISPKRDGVDPTLVEKCQDIIDEFDDRMEWPELEGELFQRSIEDGESLLRHYFDESEGTTEVRTVEPEQCRQRPGSPDWGDYYFGIRTAPHDIQKPLEYNFAYLEGEPEDEPVPADEVVHYKNTKRSVKRGLPEFSFSTLDALQIADKLRKNLGMGASIQAAIVAIRQHDQAQQSSVSAYKSGLAYTQRVDPITGLSQDQARLNPGTFLDINKGQNYVEPPGASNASAHVEVLSAILRGAGQRWNAPAWLSTSDASDTNFASSLTAESPFVKTIERRQDRFGRSFRKTKIIVLKNAIKAGLLPPDTLELVKVEAVAKSAEARNRLEEAQANQIRVMGRWKSRKKVAEEEGLDWEQTQQDIEEEDERNGGQPGQMLDLPPEDKAEGNPTEQSRFGQ